MKNLKFLLILVLLIGQTVVAQSLYEKSTEGNPDNLPVHEYTLTLKEEMVNKAGKEVKGMTVNGTIPGPTLEFTEGEYAVIYVKNEMSVETSVHWHGIILPNFYDGVPYLTTPPILPGTTFKYEFAITQNGTYWYHSHTMLQEQSGVFGSIVIKPKEKTLDYDKDLVLMLSDWTNEKPMNVLRNLKRGNEWYQMKKGTSTPLNKVIARGAFGAQLDFWRQRMEGADIADIYYPAFLINGKEVAEYPEFKAGEKVRLRIINGSASSQFWMTFGGDTPTLVAADGKDDVPVKHNKTFIAIAETYDFIVTVPEDGKIEIRAMAQDGSGTTLAYIGSGKILPAEIVPKPDKIQMMQQMAKMKMKMGAHALKFQPKKDERYEMKAEYGMQMDGMKMDGMQMDHSKMNMKDAKMNMNISKDSMMNDKIDHSKMDHSKMKMEDEKMKMDMPKDSMMNEKMDHSKMNMNDDNTKMDGMDTMQMDEMDMFSEYNYDYLKSPEKTNYDKDIPVREILLNLTGNMNRYIWSMNGVPLSEADNIKINHKEVTRITLNNLTMMHHPMHLHGHFFRVINKNGEYSPLKHTVNVAPMQEVTIEFYGNEYGDWFFHCHVLYHMMSGMARVVSYDTPSDPRMSNYPVKKLINEADQYYKWAMVDAASHMTTFNFVSSNIRNQFNVSGEYGWNKNLEAEVTYERYLHDYLRVFGGVNVENEMDDSLDQITTTAIAGVRFLTPYLFNLDVRIDSKLRPQISLSREILIFPRTAIFGMYEYQANFGWVDDLPNGDVFAKEVTWNAGVEYFLSRNFSLMASYDNRFGAGGGLSVRF
ncbi:putative multicopper oxidase [Aequorivita sublithincola DSM 14238]|uniref:Putative multicopper oxidase n=1 Tax=Aequorivita sublithincola (strain DSM 14238 / LMG 21431 / ACAM 643 / 9-3) TaxID=746697 RepID=I3Z046_AEQSU|nr:multicopper oxidase domain-containing protein [Aequorivita sublithincola]AFL82614.1 putative multicopper oxidase [Aequorivita sublithincola DSM 14238]